MVNVEIKVGPKGQILIPKLLRDEFNIMPGDELILKETEHGMLIEKPLTEDPIKKMMEIANKYGKKLKIDNHAYEKEIEERWNKIKKRVKK